MAKCPIFERFWPTVNKLFIFEDNIMVGFIFIKYLNNINTFSSNEILTRDLSPG